MTKAYLSLTGGGGENYITSSGWVNASPSLDTPIGLNALADDSSTGWTVTFSDAIGSFAGTDGYAGNGADDAVWALAPTLKKALGGPGTYSPIVFSGLDDATTYTLKFVASIDISGRSVDLRYDGVVKTAECYDAVASGPNYKQVVEFADISPVSGSITVEWKSTGSTGYLAAIAVEEAPGPTLTVTQTELTPGGTISGSYSAYETVPTTLTVSDGTNTITIPSPTISDNGDGTGTFSGNMPALPSSGTDSLILFGSVTVELT